MMLCFMAFLDLALGRRIGEPAARLGLPILITLGLASVMYWYLGEQQGREDLRLYGFMQFFPMFLVPCVLLLFPSRSGPRWDRDVLVVLALYALALVFDLLLDAPLFAIGGIISGHSLKHLIAAFAVYWLLRGL